MIAVGQMNNLVDLLASPGDGESPLAGRELVGRKVATLFVMGPYFVPSGEFLRAYNFTTSPKAAAVLVAKWPTRIKFGEGTLGHTGISSGAVCPKHRQRTPPASPSRRISPRKRRARGKWKRNVTARIPRPCSMRSAGRSTSAKSARERAK